MSFCLLALRGELSLDEANFMQIILIPKSNNADSTVGFRPISLCSVGYKVIAKIIANRLKMVLDVCINKVQGAFVSRHLISDNILVAHELMHTLKNKHVGLKESFALKLDMSKTYDKVD